MTTRALSPHAGTTFLAGLINAGIGTSVPNIVIAMAFSYGGAIQAIAGMWEMAVRSGRSRCSCQLFE
jgi:succinate-acetate transporter protein